MLSPKTRAPTRPALRRNAKPNAVNRLGTCYSRDSDHHGTDRLFLRASLVTRSAWRRSATGASRPTPIRSPRAAGDVARGARGGPRTGHAAYDFLTQQIDDCEVLAEIERLNRRTIPRTAAHRTLPPARSPKPVERFRERRNQRHRQGGLQPLALDDGRRPPRSPPSVPVPHW